MRFGTLINTVQLAVLLPDPSVVVVDCRFDLKDAAAGEHAYETAHIPGAVYAHLERDLSGPVTGTNGRHPLPDVQTFAETLGRLGIGQDSQVVAYDQDTSVNASRLWWTLRWLGHEMVAVLDGGFARWTAEHRPTVKGVEKRAPRSFHPRPRMDMLATVDAVAAELGRADRVLLDVRAPERFRGEIELVDKVAGHIPGAINHYYLENLNGWGTFRPAGELATQYRAMFGSVPPERVTCYCGSGVTACQTLLALEHAGLTGAKLYPGSWSEWCASPERPIVRSTSDAAS